MLLLYLSGETMGMGFSRTVWRVSVVARLLGGLGRSSCWFSVFGPVFGTVTGSVIGSSGLGVPLKSSGNR